MTHTKEPWAVWTDEDADFGIVTEKAGEFITFAFPNDFFDGGTQEANARRIVSCVNALAGLNPDAVAGLIEAAEALLERHEKIVPTKSKASHNLRQALACLRETNND